MISVFEKKNRNRTQYLMLAVLFLLANCTPAIKPVDQAYDDVLKKDTIQAYQMFLLIYPESTYEKDIKQRLLDLTFFKKAQSINTVRAYQQYYLNKPDGRRIKNALGKIEELELDFYKKVDTVWGYEFFLDKYPSTKFRSELQDKIEEIKFKQVLNDDKIALYEKFIVEFPDGRYVKEVTERLRALRSIKLANKVIEQSANTVVQQNIRGIFSKPFTPIPEPVSLSYDNAKITKIHFKNPSTYPVSFYFEGVDTFCENFKPGESGTVELLSGKYKLAIEIESSPSVILRRDTLDFRGKYLIYLDNILNEVGIIKLAFQLQKYSKRASFLMPNMAVADYEKGAEAYNKEIDRLEKIRVEAESLAFPLKRTAFVRDVSPFKSYKIGSKTLNIEDQIIEQNGNVVKRDVVMPLIGIIAIASDGERCWDPADYDYYRKSIPSDFESSNPFCISNPDETLRRQKNDAVNDAIETLVGLKSGVNKAVRESLKYGAKNRQSALLKVLSKIPAPEDEKIFVRAVEEKYEDFRDIALEGIYGELFISDKGLDIINYENLSSLLLQTLYEDNRLFVREGVFRVLDTLASKGKLKIRITPDTFNLIFNIFHDKHGSSFENARLFLEDVPRRMVDESVFALVNSGDDDKKRILCKILVKDSSQRDSDLLLECLKSPYHETVEGAVSALAEQRNEGAMDSLINLLITTDNIALQERITEILALMKTERSVNKLLELLNTINDDDKFKEKIIDALGKTDSPLAANVLLKLYPSSRYAWKVQNLLIKMGKPAIPCLQQTLHIQDTSIRIWAISTLGSIDDEDALRVLVEALGDDNTSVRKKAAEALYNNEIFVRKEKVPYYLISALNNRTPSYKDEIIDVIIAHKIKEALPSLENIFNKDLIKGRINYPLISALCIFGKRELAIKAEPTILESLKTKMPQEDWRKFAALGEMRDESAVEPLLGMLENHDRMDQVAFTLGKIDSKKAVRPLLDFLEELKDNSKKYFEKTDISYQRLFDKTVDALAQIGDSEAAGPLISMLEDDRLVPFTPLHNSLLQALSRIGGPAANRALVWELNKYKDIYGFGQAKFVFLSLSLQQITDESVIEGLSSILKDGTIDAKRTAIRILGEIKNNESKHLLINIFRNNDDLYADAARMLGKFGRPIADELINMLDTVKGDRKRDIIFALEKTGHNRALITVLNNITVAGHDMRNVLKRIVNARFPELVISDLRFYDVLTKLGLPVRSGFVGTSGGVSQ